jgi:protein-disulfide isomerase/uncharacterized membrane protein
MSKDQKQSFYQAAPFNTKIMGGVAAVAMVILSIYLTKHYFDVKFPTGLTGGGLCDINSFFNCDVATHSHLSNIAGVPISLMGLLMGLFVLVGFFWKDEKVEGTVHLLLWVNAVGCIALFFFSLIALGGLCPACTLYYVFSWLALYAFHRTSKLIAPGPVPAITYLVAFGVMFGSTYSYVAGKEAKNSAAKSKLAQSLTTQYDNLKNLGAPELKSEFLLANVEGGFDKAPIRITKFSDFECPACRMLSENLHEVAKKYAGKIAIQYFFYPLDSSCNPEMKSALHQNACQAAYLAACLPQKFPEIEEKIFNNQANLSYDWILGVAKEEGVEECMKSSATKEKVVSYINAAKPFTVRSTPTFLLNGVKIEGVLPVSQLEILIDHVLQKQ